MTRKEAIEVLQASSIKQMSLTKIIVNGKALSVKTALEMAIKALKQEPKTGHWVDTDEGFSPCECSECNSVEFIKSKFCPNCGARMESDEKTFDIETYGDRKEIERGELYLQKEVGK